MSQPTPSTRLQADSLILTIDGKDYAADITEWEISFEEADKDTLTFAEVNQGGGDVGKLKVTAIQSTDPTSLHRIIWANAGRKKVPFVIAPHGNKAASATQPHITGTLDIGLRPKQGSQAGKKSPTFEYEFEATVAKEWKVTG